jgi:myo-inositol-1(or 4)-monophosphatase
MPDPQVLRDLALEIAREVAPELRARAGRTSGIRTKSSYTDLVSDTDRWSEERIVTRLNETRPYDEIVSEEGMQVSGTSGVRWLVDPIDGTTDFVYGHPGFSISIGAELGDEPIAGVVVDPLLDEAFAAARGAGATRNGRPIEVSLQIDLSRALVATGFGYHPDRRRRQAEGLVEILPRVGDIRRMGGAALDLAYVACGRVDAFFERGLAAWDVAAGRVLVAEAGGSVSLIKTPTSGPTGEIVIKPLDSFEDWDPQAVVVAAGPGIHDALVELLIEAKAHEGP